LNLLRNHVQLERIFALHGRECGRLAIPAVEQLPPSGDAVRWPFRRLSNLQKAAGSLLRLRLAWPVGAAENSASDTRLLGGRRSSAA
jgi:hypothetical protein